MRPTLFDTPFVRARDAVRHMAEALTFILKNQHVVVQSEQLDEIASQKIYSSTPVCKVFKAIAAVQKLNNFMFLDYSTLQQTNIPEILTSDDLCVDGSAALGSVVPAFAKKCWINITPILGKRDAYNDHLFFTDQSQLANLVTRAALVTAYADKDLWLTFKQALYVIELYATVIAQVITNTYTLNPDERRLVMTMFALYYAQLCGPASANPEEIPPLVMRCQFLGDGSDILRVFSDLAPYRDKEIKCLTLAGIVRAINTFGPPRMKNYTVQMLYRSLSASSIDSSTMVIAMDYPPYFVYQLMRVASGYKNPIISGIVKALGVKNKLLGFADDVADNPNLIGALNRC